MPGAPEPDVIDELIDKLFAELMNCLLNSHLPGNHYDRHFQLMR
jgi:hypothetical protein